MSESKILIKTTGQDGANVTFTTTQFTAISWSLVGMQGGHDMSASVYGYVSANTLVELCRIVDTDNGYGVIDLGDKAAQYSTLVVKLNRPMRSGTFYVSAERESISANQFWQDTPRRYIGEWGSLPAAGANGFSARFITASGVFSALSDGVRWRLISALATLQPNASVTGTTAETTLSSITIPAGLLGTDGTIRVYALLSFTGVAGAKNLRLRMGGNQYAFVGTSAAALSASIQRNVSNLTVNSQAAYTSGSLSEGGSASTAITTFAVDTSADTTVTVTVQLGAAADAATLVKVVLEVL